MLPILSFVLGGAASGKSAWAENLILNSGLNPVYVATGAAFDAEMQTKIFLHQERRGAQWINFEAEKTVDGVLGRLEAGQAALLDCATMWLNNRIMAEHPLHSAPQDFLKEISAAKAPLIVVSNEVGQGIVPDNALARQFREAQGRLNIAVAQQADLVVQVVAGLPNVLKGELP